MLLGCRTSDLLTCTSGTPVGGRGSSPASFALRTLQRFVHPHLFCRNEERTGPVGSPEHGVKCVCGALDASSSEEAECGLVITVWGWGLVSNCYAGTERLWQHTLSCVSGPSNRRVTVLHNVRGDYAHHSPWGWGLWECDAVYNLCN